MKRPWLWFCVVGIALTLLTFSCSREPATVTGPSTDDAAGPAPLMRAAADAEVVPGSYIVVFKSTVVDVDRRSTTSAWHKASRPSSATAMLSRVSPPTCPRRRSRRCAVIPV